MGLQAVASLRASSPKSRCKPGVVAQICHPSGLQTPQTRPRSRSPAKPRPARPSAPAPARQTEPRSAPRERSVPATPAARPFGAESPPHVESGQLPFGRTVQLADQLHSFFTKHGGRAWVPRRAPLPVPTSNSRRALGCWARSVQHPNSPCLPLRFHSVLWRQTHSANRNSLPASGLRQPQRDIYPRHAAVLPEERSEVAGRGVRTPGVRLESGRLAACVPRQN